MREGKNRDQALAEIRVHAPKRRAVEAEFRLRGGRRPGHPQGAGLCQDAATKIRALREALAQAEMKQGRGPRPSRPREHLRPRVGAVPSAVESRRPATGAGRLAAGQGGDDRAAWNRPPDGPRGGPR